MSTSFLRTPLDSGFDIYDSALDTPLILCAPILLRRLGNSLLALPSHNEGHMTRRLSLERLGG